MYSKVETNLDFVKREREVLKFWKDNDIATKTPAQSLGIYGRCGSLTPGKQADITIFRNAAEIQMTIVRGKTVYTKS